jgi:hypothetical protein
MSRRAPKHQLSLQSQPPAQGRLIIENRPLAQLQLGAHNPREHPPRQIKQIAGSIKTFGFNAPI